MKLNRNGVLIADETQKAFVRTIASHDAVLDAINAGHTAVAAAAGNTTAMAEAVASTWAEIAEMEGTETAETICNELWPLDADYMAAAA